METYAEQKFLLYHISQYFTKKKMQFESLKNIFGGQEGTKSLYQTLE